jgi:hypothetical protein
MNIYIIIWVLYFLLLAHLIFKRYNIYNDILDPIIVFSLLLTAYGFIAFLAAQLGSNFSQIVLEKYSIANFIALMAIYFGTNFKFKLKKYNNNSIISNSRLLPSLIFWALILNLIFFDNFIRLLSFSPDSYVDSAVRASRTASSGPISFFKEISLILIFNISILSNFNRPKIKISTILIFGFICLFGLKAGGKSTLIICLLYLIFFYHYEIKKISFLFLFFISLLLYPIFLMLNHVRSTSQIFEMINLAIFYIKDDLSILSPIAFGELTGPPITLMEIINRNIVSSDALTFGSSWLNEILVFIPSFIYANRPLPSSEQYMKIFHPNALEGLGEGWFIISDGYWAFGNFGVFILLFLYSTIISSFYTNFRKSDKLVTKISYPFLYFILVITSIRTGFFGSIKISILYLFVISIIYLTSLYMPKIKFK